MRHEFIHVKQKHSIDILWGEVLCIVNWFNPFAWLIRNAIRQNLEFIADNKVLEDGIDKKQYQYLLLKVTGNNHYSIANQFNFSSLKKRIAMMNKMRSAQMHLVKFLFILPIVAVMLLAFRRHKEIPEQKGVNQKTSFFNAEKPNIIDTPPPPPVPPAPLKLPRNVKTIDISNNKATVKLSDGTMETYDLSNAKDKENFESKYGDVLPPPPPVPPSPPVRPVRPDHYKLPENVIAINIDDNNKAFVKLKNGKTEEYNLGDAKEKTEFEKKYGRMPSPPPPPPPPVESFSKQLT